MFNPRLKRFNQRDPLGYPDGMNTYAAYHVMRGGVDPYGLEWEWPLSENASWSIGGTARLWGGAAGSAASATIDVEGHANWVLTGKRDPSEEVFEAGASGWLRGLGNPFGAEGGVGTLLYTGKINPSDEVLAGSINAARKEVGEEGSCYWDCMCDLHKQGIKVLTATVAAAYAPTPKSLLKPFLSSGNYGSYLQGGKWGSSISHVGALAYQYRHTAIGGKVYSWALKHRHIFKTARQLFRGKLPLTGPAAAAALRTTAKGAIVVELSASTFCSLKCLFDGE